MKPKTPDLMTMRKLGFILLAVIIGITAQAKDKTVIRPAFKSMTKDAILPVKVEQTKDATIVHFHIVCAAHRNWSMDGAQLRVDGQTFACRQARIITHDGPVVLADEPFEFGKKIERDARKDSVILYFDPLPKDTKTFDYIEGENRNSWQIFGIRRETFLKRRNCSSVLERAVSTNRKPIIASNILRRLFRIVHQGLLLRILNHQ